MNNFQIEDILKEYPVTVCSSDEVTYKEGEFIISNTQPSYSIGEHWVVLYFGKEEADEFFDSLGNWPEHHSLSFEAVLNKPYLLTLDQIQSSYSDKCAQYCIYYVVCRCAGLDMQTLLNVFDINDKEGNDEIIRSLTHIEN